MNRNGIKLYNVLFPIWMLIFIPTYLWLLLIPANYLIDRAVLYFSLGNESERSVFCRKNTWKICLAGFLADFVGAFLLFVLLTFQDMFPEGSAFAEAISQMATNPFGGIAPFMLIAIAIVISGVVIFYLDRWILRNNGLSAVQAAKSALWLAIITAPYLFLIPTTMIYRS